MNLHFRLLGHSLVELRFPFAPTASPFMYFSVAWWRIILLSKRRKEIVSQVVGQAKKCLLIIVSPST